jgi:hypothetical protein
MLKLSPDFSETVTHLTKSEICFRVAEGQQEEADRSSGRVKGVQEFTVSVKSCMCLKFYVY